MNDPNAARDKLERIKQLWSELEQTAEESPEHNNLIEKIRALSAEYRKLSGAKAKPERSAKGVSNGTDVGDL